MKLEIGAFAMVVVVSGIVFAWVRFCDEAPRAEEGGVLALAEQHHLATPLMIAVGDRAAGTQAADFEAIANDGETYRLSEITRKGPAVLIFIKDDCPCSRSADEFLQRAHSAGRGWIPFYGVIDGDPKIAARWADQTGTTFPILADPDRKIIKSFGAENSAYVAFLGPGGRIEKLWAGYSASMLRELGSRMAPWVETGMQPFDVSDAPAELYAGCPYEDE